MSKRLLIPLTLLLTAQLPAFAFDVPAATGPLRAYLCERTEQAPTIDGRLDDSAWSDVLWSEKFTDIEGDLKPAPRFDTRCAMLWDDEYFYIAARMDEPHLQASLTERDAVIYHDNDFEVFIDPDGDNHLYYELEVNALNTVWDLLLIKPYRDGAPAVNAWDIQGLKTAVFLDGTLNDASDVDRGWTVEIAIPWSVLGQCANRPSPPKPGHIWRVNFSRVQWQFEGVDGGYQKTINPETGKSFPENNWVWSPQGLIAMHCPENWGEVLFVGTNPGGEPRQSLELNAEHKSINIARSLMAVYYAQRSWQEEHGAFACTIEELAAQYSGLMDEWVTMTGTNDGPVLKLPYKWSLEMESNEQRFSAILHTPVGTMTVDETGRLQRHPLSPDQD